MLYNVRQVSAHPNGSPVASIRHAVSLREALLSADDLADSYESKGCRISDRTRDNETGIYYQLVDMCPDGIPSHWIEISRF